MSQCQQNYIRQSKESEGVHLKRAHQIAMQKMVKSTLCAASRAFVAGKHIESALRENNFRMFGVVRRIKIDAPCGKHHKEGNQ